jgi:hypothetical protein
MVSVSNARKMALTLPEAEEKKHFETPDFRVGNKIFASLHEAKGLMMVKLNAVDQSVFCAYDPDIIYPVPGGWGKKGATFVNLKKVPKAMLQDALTTAWKTVAKTTLVKKYFSE